MTTKNQEPPVRVAILGGGIAALTAALLLTDKARRRKYEVTVYQMGWRLGGKGASGRNPEHGNRIEEHGIHVWFGFYENAFKLMRACYNELASSPDFSRRAIKRCDDDAFTPQNLFMLNEHRDDLPHPRWERWKLDMPHNKRRPGDAGGAIQGQETLFFHTFRNIRDAIAPYEDQRSDAAPPQAHELITDDWDDQEKGQLNTLLQQMPGAPAEHDGILRRSLHAGRALSAALELLVSEAGELETWLDDVGDAVWRPDSLKLKVGALSVALRVARQVLKPLAEAAPETIWIHRAYLIADTCAAVATGVYRDLFRDGKTFLDLDVDDLRVWLQRHGADARYLNQSPTVRFIYNSAFSFKDGDCKQPAIGAGSAIYGSLRLALTYKGSLCYRMASGMGDVVFGPIYEVLRARQVTFKFFHRVDALEVGASGDGDPVITGVRIKQQVRLTSGDATGYDPLMKLNLDSRGVLPCWPDRPRFEQLADGALLRDQVRDGLNLEDPTARWKDESDASITVGADGQFDQVVLGIPIAALKTICAPLITHPTLGARWKTMVDQVATTATQAFQVWLCGDLKTLGWTDAAAVMGTYQDPIDTYIDMTPALLTEESRPEIKNLSYFCGVIEDVAGEDHPTATLRARTNALELLRRRASYMWPLILQNDGVLNWRMFFGASDGSDQQIFRAQYARANVLPSERYTLGLPNTSAQRLLPSANHPEGSGCRNLWPVGDWTRNPLQLNLGCIESTVCTALAAMRELTGEIDAITIIGEDPQYLWQSLEDGFVTMMGADLVPTGSGQLIDAVTGRPWTQAVRGGLRRVESALGLLGRIPVLGRVYQLTQAVIRQGQRLAALFTPRRHALASAPPAQAAETIRGEWVPQSVEQLADWGRRALDELEQHVVAGTLSLRDHAATVAAHLGLGQPAQALKWLHSFVQRAGADAGELGMLRGQLDQISQATARPQENQTLLALLDARLLRRADGALTLGTRDLRALSATVPAPEAGVLGNDDLQLLAWYQRGLVCCRAVGRIQNAQGVPLGSGFLVSAAEFLRAGAPGQTLLLTSAQVLARVPAREARVLFAALDSPGAPATIKQVLWTSPPGRLDAALCVLEQPASALGLVPAPVRTSELHWPPRRRPRLFEAGHTAALDLSYTLQSKPLLSVDDSHVRDSAPLAQGSDGNPIFDEQWRLVALRRTAHDGIRLSAIIAQLRAAGF